MKLLAKITMLAVVWLSIPFWVYGFERVDLKNYPGIGCKPQVEGTLRTTEISIINVSNDPQGVVCPIVIDPIALLESTNVAIVVEGRVRAGDSLRCEVFSIRVFEGLDGNFERSILERGAKIFVPVTDRNPLIIDHNPQTTYYSLSCTLPRGGRIFSYIVDFFKP